VSPGQTVAEEQASQINQAWFPSVLAGKDRRAQAAAV